MKVRAIAHLTAALLTVTITVQSNVDNSTPTVLTVPGQSFWGIDLEAVDCMDTTTQMAVDCGTPTVRAVGVSTGPVIMKSPTTPDCYKIPFVNPNGSCGPTTYVPCP